MFFDFQPTLKGEFLELRPLRAEDFHAPYAVAADPLIWEQHPVRDRYKEEVFKGFFRDDKLTVVVFANLAQANADKIARDVAAIYNPELMAPPAKAIEDKEPKVTALVKELVQKFPEGAVDPNLFMPKARAKLFPDAAKQAGAFLKSLGALSLIELVERKEEVGNRVYRYRLTFKETILFGKIMLTKEGKIAGIQLQPE